MAVEIEESTIAQVKSFIEEKRKKKEPSKKDADEFEQLWLAAVEENDLDKETFALLCDGFRYAGARPLFKHFKMKNTSKLPYATLGTYEPIRKNTNELELKVFMSLLALELLDPTSAEQVVALLKKIPEAALTKGNKITGNLSSFVRRLMLSELAEGTIKVDAAEIKMMPKDISRFVKLIGPIVAESAENDKLKTGERNAAKNLRSWLESLYEIEAKVETITDESAPSEVTGNPAQEDTWCGDAETSKVDQIVLAVKGLGAALSDRDRKIESLKSVIVSDKSEIVRLKDRGDSLKDQSTELKATLDKSRETIIDLNAKIASLEQQLDKLSADLSASRQMVELLEQTVSKQSDETIKRISRKLKIEFDDYRDAVDLDMDTDLGENMRLQLGSVFRILKENGFEL